MPVFTFRLQPLLDQKLEAEREAKIAFTLQAQALEREQNTLVQCLEAEKRTQRQVSGALAELLHATQTNAGIEIQRRNDYLLGLQQDLRSAQDKVLFQKFVVEEAEVKLKQARHKLVECSREVQKLTKFCDKLKSRFLADLTRKEAWEQDEAATVLYLRGKAGL